MPRADPRVVTPELLRDWPLPEPADDGSKHDRGTLLVVGGSEATPGAVLLAGLAGLRVGAGRLQVATVQTTSVALGVALPEAMVVGMALEADAADQLAGLAQRCAALVIGPGMSGKDSCRTLLRRLLPQLPDVPVLLDAVALTALAGHRELLDGLQGRAVLTPNGGELAALLEGDPATGVDAATLVARRYGAVVSVSGCVACPDGRSWTDAAGGIGLGTSGSGDVLAGAVGGLLARGCPPEQAAVWGRHAHAAAGDRLAEQVGRLGFLARELLDELVPVLTALRT